ncbi:hypothetical protein [Nocardioides marmorisolisilvae]|uniref:Uncharacterized protein n=1 Tax=Nocardioides marmorisolisilvae TaxID=1542737 RepID=A0A3N0DVE4_9ACTN|nr:hypothetical protein [Nocardioides marmorisolisilvae]RNL79592.1 hypothetical protein EFL95_11500 [Nocardioides marmorisolisilvae]
MLLASLLVVVLVAGAFWIKHERRADEWRHGGDDVTVQARIEATDAARFGDALATAGGDRNDAIVDAEQGFVIRVRWTGSPAVDGSYQFVLLDNRVSPSQMIRAASASVGGKGFGANWAGAYEELHRHYAWLAGTAAKQLPDGSYTEDTNALGVPAQNQGAATLAYWITKPTMPTTNPAHDLKLAMFFVDSDGEVRWARDIPMEPLG